MTAHRQLRERLEVLLRRCLVARLSVQLGRQVAIRLSQRQHHRLNNRL